MGRVSVNIKRRREGHVSLCCLEAWLGFWLLLLLLLVEDDADDVSLVLLHVLHQSLFTGGLEAADAAAEKEHAVFHAEAWNGGLACARLALGLELELCWVLPLGALGFDRPL